MNSDGKILATLISDQQTHINHFTPELLTGTTLVRFMYLRFKSFLISVMKHFNANYRFLLEFRKSLLAVFA